MLASEAPGKLVLIGEYAVLCPGGEALVVAVGPGVVASADGRRDGLLSISAPRLQEGVLLGKRDGGKLHFDHPQSDFLCHALRVCEARWGPLSLQLRIEPARWRQHMNLPAHLKPGLGSSAAATAACIAAVAEHLGQVLSPELLFELAYEAHFQAQGGRGSGIDVAASCLGGIASLTTQGGGLQPLVQSLNWPQEWPILGVFSGQSTGTVNRVKRFLELCENRPKWQRAFVQRSNQLVVQAKQAIKGGNWSDFLQAIGASRLLLLELGDLMQVNMEGPGLSAMIEAINSIAIGKQSGAGGGDSGLVFPLSFSSDIALRTSLRAAGLTVMDLNYAVVGPLAL